MRSNDGRWTDAELELFHDGELDAARAEALSAALREGPALRARVSRVARADEWMTRALTAAATPRPARERGSWWGGRRVWAAALMLMVVGAAGVVVLMRAGMGMGVGATGSAVQDSERRGPLASGPDRQGAQGEAADAYRAVRVVFSLPSAKGAAGAETQSPRGPGLGERVDAALVSGRVEEAVGLAKEAGPGEKEEVYRRFGGALRSSETAMAALDAMSPEEQVAACKQWIAAGQQRPYAMARLRMLGRRAELEEPIRVAVRELLADDPHLRTWVMSYVPWAVEKS